MLIELFPTEKKIIIWHVEGNKCKWCALHQKLAIDTYRFTKFDKDLACFHYRMYAVKTTKDPYLIKKI